MENKKPSRTRDRFFLLMKQVSLLDDSLDPRRPIYHFHKFYEYTVKDGVKT